MLDELVIVETEDTPKVILDATNNIFEISGKSLPEDANKFFAPVKQWLKDYIKNPNETTEFICKIEYANSSSVKKLLEIYIILETITNKSVEVKWYYEKGDRLMETKGSEYKELLNIPFDLIEIDRF